MSFVRALAVAAAAAVVMIAGGSLEANADVTPSVYDTPGGQISHGRLWNTTCEEYSSTVVRCRAEIWATTVSYLDGRYVKKTGWAFNNLSYLPSSRSVWARNNLGTTNDSWTSGGRQWKTECDTAATGQGGCRSYVRTEVIREEKANSGARFSRSKEWVFNNLVLFSTKSTPPVNKVPGWIIDQSRLSFTGLGPLQVGTPMKDLETLGYVRDVFDTCQFWPSNQSLVNRGVYVNHDSDEAVPQRAAGVAVMKPGIRTTAGAEVGMTLADIRAIYGSSLKLETKRSIFDVYAAVVREGGNELVFTASPINRPSKPLKDSDIIDRMEARTYSDWIGGDC